MCRWLLILVLLTCVSVPIFGQKDSLSDKSYVELSKILNSYYPQDTTQLLRLTKVYLDKAIRENDLENESIAYITYAQTYALTPFEQKALKYAQQSIETAKTAKNDTILQECYYRLGYFYSSINKYPESIDSYYTALRISDSLGTTKKSLQIIVTLGAIKGTLEDHLGAIEILKSGLGRLKTLEDTDVDTTDTKRLLRIRFLGSIANSFNNGNEPDSTLHYIDRVLEVTTKKEDSCFLKPLYAMQARALIATNRFDEAERAIKSAYSYCLPLTKNDSLRYSGDLGKIFLNRKAYRKSVTILRKGLSDYNVTPDEEKYMMDYYKTLAKAYKGLKIIDSANFYLEKHIVTTTNFGDLKDNYTSAFKKQELKEFKQEIAALQTQKEKNARLLTYLIAGGSAVIATLLSLLFLFHTKRKENEAKFEALLTRLNNKTVVEETLIDTKDKTLDEQGTSDINPETTAQILEGLERLREQEFFLRSGCNAVNVSKKIKTNTTYLSKVINAQFGKNFTTYINDLRINYAVRRLKDDTRFRGYTVSAIAQELGYKSADSFTKYFKQHTGLLPSFYIKKLNASD